MKDLTTAVQMLPGAVIGAVILFAWFMGARR